MASVEVLSATIAHAEEAKLEPINKAKQITKDEVASSSPPPPPSEQKQTESEIEQNEDVALDHETLVIDIESKAVLAPEPVVDKTTETAELAPEPKNELEALVVEHKDDAENPVEEEKISPQAKLLEEKEE